ncbi:hypothetical protein JOC94_001354 [Bacillus thermophilus]|uniref:Uncharacterized protein n=1 Tax=Siminovitchia thermophila TaxID=1245522 RepID=A0ABS2R3Z9_9BACI|nr:hypothetical protein [Siminovitchia thermophila]
MGTLQLVYFVPNIGETSNKSAIKRVVQTKSNERFDVKEVCTNEHIGFFQHTRFL